MIIPPPLPQNLRYTLWWTPTVLLTITTQSPSYLGVRVSTYAYLSPGIIVFFAVKFEEEIPVLVHLLCFCPPVRYAPPVTEDVPLHIRSLCINIPSASGVQIIYSPTKLVRRRGTNGTVTFHFETYHAVFANIDNHGYVFSGHSHFRSRIFTVCAPSTLCPPPPVTEHKPLHSKALCKNISRAPGGCK